MTTVLLTGFEPFGGDTANPSGDGVRLVAERWRGSERLVTAVLPVSFTDAAIEFGRLVDEHAPDVIIATGLAGGRAEVAVERVAVNLADARIPDNTGEQPLDQEVVADGPVGIFASLPVKAIVREVSAAGIPCTTSHSAGTFVCNALFYRAALHAQAHPGVRAGFVHVPWAVGQSAGAPELRMQDLVEAVEIAIWTTLTHTEDVAAAGGSLF